MLGVIIYIAGSLLLFVPSAGLRGLFILHTCGPSTSQGAWSGGVLSKYPLRKWVGAYEYGSGATRWELLKPNFAQKNIKNWQ